MGDFLFEPIPREDLPKLVHFLKESLPISTVAYHWIGVQTIWEEEVPGVELQILCPRGDWRAGAVVGLAKGLVSGDQLSGMFWAAGESCDATLTASLALSPLLPWCSVAHFAGVRDCQLAGLLAALAARGVPEPHVIPCHVYHMTSQHAASLQPPQPRVPGAHVVRLEARHVDQVCDTWPHFTPELRPQIVAMVTNNLSAGVLMERQDGGQELASSVLQAYYGGLGLLQTLPEYRGQGLASLVLAHLARSLGQRGIDPHLHVVRGNLAAARLVTRTGFELLGDFSRVVLTQPT